MKSKKTEYTYNCVDKSILLGPFKKYYVSLFYFLVPRKITANYITLISSALMWGVFYLSLNPGSIAEPTLLATIFALLLHFYVVGDHLDGMHAKNTGTSSPLGEFLDHYFDIYNTAIFVLAYFTLLHVSEPLYFKLMVWLSFVAVGATMVEELERGELYFGTIGTLEAIFITLILFISCIFPEGLKFWSEGRIFDIPMYWILIISGVVAFAGTTGDILVRMKTIPKPFALFTITGLLLSLAMESQGTGNIEAWLVLALYSGDYIGRVMRNYLLGLEKQPYPDRLVTIYTLILLVLVALNLAPTEFLDVGKTLFIIYLAARTTISFGRTIYYFKEHWDWINP